MPILPHPLPALARKTGKTARALAGATALGAAVLLTGCGGIATNRSLDSIHQPVVDRASYTLDLATNANGMPYSEQRRLVGWFEALGLRGSDHLYLDDPAMSPATRAAVEATAARFGVVVEDGAPTTAGAGYQGAARVVLVRSKASVPGCPDWTSDNDFNPNNATSANYGCATNSNLAAMVADPEHLLRGATGNGDQLVMRSNRAIQTMRETEPTGAKELPKSDTKGSN